MNSSLATAYFIHNPDQMYAMIHFYTILSLLGFGVLVVLGIIWIVLYIKEVSKNEDISFFKAIKESITRNL